MPLSRPAARRDIYRRVVDMQAFAREDGPYDVEAHRVDTKPFPFPHSGAHDLWVRLTLDAAYVVQAVEAGWSSKVKQRLRGAAGCTHLTEMLITTATTAYQGIRILRRLERGTHVARATEQLDTCYTYSSEREVVRMYWPELYRGNAGGEGTR